MDRQHTRAVGLIPRLPSSRGGGRRAGARPSLEGPGGLYALRKPRHHQPPNQRRGEELEQAPGATGALRMTTDEKRKQLGTHCENINIINFLPWDNHVPRNAAFWKTVVEAFVYMNRTVYSPTVDKGSPVEANPS